MRACAGPVPPMTTTRRYPVRAHAYLQGGHDIIIVFVYGVSRTYQNVYGSPELSSNVRHRTIVVVLNRYCMYKVFRIVILTRTEKCAR